jgi:hypothetical protein
MKSRKKPANKQPTEKEIDNLVESQADDDSAWGKPIYVRRARPESLSLAAALAARAVCRAKLNREKKANCNLMS